MHPYDALRLENQLCFPLYAAAKEVVRLYTPHLDKIGLTYTQYIVMMLVWDTGGVAVKELGERLYLDTGTLTPLLRKLESKKLVVLNRDEADRRSVLVHPTAAGMALRDAAVEIPRRVGACVPLAPQEAATLYQLAYKVLGALSPPGGGDENPKE